MTELAAAGVPSILVPLVVSTTNHQHANAEFMAANRGDPPAAIGTDRRSWPMLRSLTRDRLLAMAMQRAVGKPEATETVATVIERVAA